MESTGRAITVMAKFKEALAYEWSWPLRLMRYVALLQRGRKRFWLSMIPGLAVCIASMMQDVKYIRDIVMWMYLIIGAINFTFVIWLMAVVRKAIKHVYFTTGVLLEWKSAIHLLNSQNELKGWLK